MHKTWPIVEKVILAVGLVLFGVFVAKAFAQNVPQSYQTTQSLQPGIIVRLSPSNGSYIEPLSQASQTDMLGVVVSPDDAPVSLSNNSTQQQTFVASSGEYDVLVSSQGGPIEIGNYITISSLDGVGMKASATQKIVLGKAVQAFDGKTNVASSVTLTNSNGSKQTVALSRIAVDIGVTHNPLYTSTQSTNGVPHFLAAAAQLVVNKPVGAIRIYAGLAVVVVTLLIAGGLLYAGVRSGVTAIGRNPLAKKSIMRGLITVTLMALIVFIIGLLAVYLLLRI
jgi:hypothetical protein